MLSAKVGRCDVHQTVYYPGSEAYYRASVVGDQLLVEYLNEPDTADVPEILSSFGINGAQFDILGVKHQKYGKLFTDAPEQCRRFVLYLTDRFRIYSLGRFATWRSLVLDDVVKDLGVIYKLIGHRDGYQKSLAVAS